MAIADTISSMQDNLKNAYDSVENKGGKLVRLPEEYQEVEYIESTGTQYIDTGLNGYQFEGIEVKFKNPLAEQDWESVCGVINVNPSMDIKQYYSDLNIYQINAYSKMNVTGKIEISANTEPATISIRKGEIKVNNELKATITSLGNAYNNQGNFVIFRGNDNWSKLQVYKFKMFDNNETLIRNFIPCYRKNDNEIGLYDLVNNVFYNNQGTGTFLKGNDVLPKKNLQNLSSAIDSIQTDEWKPQPDWWDIESILENDTEDYPAKAIFLCGDFVTQIIFMKNNNIKKIKTSDGKEYDTTNFRANITHIWDSSKDKKSNNTYNTRYFIYYFDTTTPSLPAEGTFGDVRTNDNGIIYFALKNCDLTINGFQFNWRNKGHLENIKLINSKILSGYSTFYGCKYIVETPPIHIIDFANNSGNALFYNCNYLKKHGEIIVDRDFKNTNNLFYNCHNLKEINLPNTENVTNFSDMISGCLNLEKINALDFKSSTANISLGTAPKLHTIGEVKNIKKSINISSLVSLKRETILKFLIALEDYSFDTSETTYTLTLGTINLAKLTDEEKAIATNKGWVLE